MELFLCGLWSKWLVTPQQQHTTESYHGTHNEEPRARKSRNNDQDVKQKRCEGHNECHNTDKLGKCLSLAARFPLTNTRANNEHEADDLQEDISNRRLDIGVYLFASHVGTLSSQLHSSYADIASCCHQGHLEY